MRLLRLQSEQDPDSWNPEILIRLGYTAKTNAQNARIIGEAAKAKRYLEQARNCFQDILEHIEIVKLSAPFRRYYLSGAHNGMANVMQMSGNLNGAVSHYQQATEINHKNTFAFWDYYGLLEWLVNNYNQGWCQEAIRIAERAVPLISGSPDFTPEVTEELKKRVGRLKETCREMTVGGRE